MKSPLVLLDLMLVEACFPSLSLGYVYEKAKETN